MAAGVRARPVSPAAVGDPVPGAEVELDIDAIAAGGEGVGRTAEGRVVFVARTAPGDRVAATLRQVRPRWARATLERVLRPGPERHEPPCPLYDRCGGCDLQHLAAPAQRAAKRDIVRQALRRIGGVAPEVGAVETAGEDLGYRNRLRFTLRRDGEEESRVTAGFHRLAAPSEVLDVPDCPLGEAALRQAWRALRDAWGPGAAALPGGSELQVTLRTGADGALALHVRGGDPARPGDPAAVRAALPGLSSYVWDDASGGRSVPVGDATWPDRWDGIEFRLGPEVFLQANRAVARRIDEALEEFAAPLTGLRVSDLYAGAGARAIRWARAGAEVTAVELDRVACEAGRAAAERAGARLRFLRGRVEDLLPRVLAADLVIANPPRAGMTAPVTAALAAAERPRRLACVSCDPATLARDLGRLAPTWRVDEVRVYDAFPQTGHVETVAFLRRREDADHPREGTP
ncbi:MAG: TRAM domain-containing protein [Gemmatimonadota bacterium]|nr:TRAM domain-containing protein [Gemmatimonadota bacterium]